MAELITWWLESAARHQFKPSTFDSHQRFGRYLVAEIGRLPVVEVGPETLIAWQSSQLGSRAPLTVLNTREARSLGNRPRNTVRRAAQLLDPTIGDAGGS